jgi:hypothetical protein
VDVFRAAKLACLVVCGALLPAQRTARTTLAVQVNEEARLTPDRVTLRFTVAANGRSGYTAQTVPVSAWVRALPGRRIRLTAALAGGSLPAGALRWNGAATRATGGAQAATCTSGVFTAGEPAALADNWNRSGILTCAVTFSVDAALAPGEYTADLSLTLQAQ